MVSPRPLPVAPAGRGIDGPGRVGAVEALEDVGDVVRRDPGALVRDTERDPRVLVVDDRSDLAG